MMLKNLWEWLNGRKTKIGAVALVIITGAKTLGWLDPATADVLLGLAGTLFGVGVAHKVQKARREIE